MSKYQCSSCGKEFNFKRNERNHICSSQSRMDEYLDGVNNIINMDITTESNQDKGGGSILVDSKPEPTQSSLKTWR